MIDSKSTRVPDESMNKYSLELNMIDPLLGEKLSRLYAECSANQICDLIWTTGTLYCDANIEIRSMERLRNQTKNVLLAQLSSSGANLSSKDVCKSFVGLARMRCEADPQLLDYIDVYLYETSAQGLSNLIWSLGEMRYTYADMSLGIRNKLLFGLQDKAADFTDQGFSSLMYGLANMDVKWEDDFLSTATKSALFSILSRLSLKMSSHASGVTLYSLGI